MKQKFTLLALLFMLTTLAFGQKALKNHENISGSGIEKHLKDADHKSRENISERIFHKQQPEFQNSTIKSSQENKHRLDSLVELSWDSGTSQWISNWKEELTYDARGNVAQHYYYQTNEIDGSWVVIFKKEFTYDSNGNSLTEIAYEWDEISSQLVADTKVEYTYGEYGMTEYIYSERDEVTGLLVKSWKEVITYDSNGNITLYSDYAWDTGSNDWLINLLAEVTYDSNRNITQYIEYYYDAGQWYNNSKSEYSYDENGNMSQYIEFYYDEDSWYVYYKTEYTYDEIGNMTEVIEYDMDMSSGEFVMFWKSEYDYDTNGNPTKEIYYDFDEESSEFIVTSKYDYSYDLLFGLDDLIIPSLYWFIPDFSNQIMNKPTEYTNYDWDSDLDDWVADYKSTYYYSEDNSTKVTDWDKNISKIYPNPVSEYITFSIAGNSNNATFELFDLQGRKIMSRDVNNNEKINLKNINSGMYLYHLYVDGNKQTGKIIKE